MQIQIVLPTDRRNLGEIRVVNDSGVVIAGPFPAYGRADRGTAALHDNGNGSPAQALVDPTRPFGDTPMGEFRVDGFQQPRGADDSLRHGPYDRIRLTPTGGEAATAAANGRVGLQIHGGNANALGQLRPTNGCIRVSDANMSAILTAIRSAGSPPNRCAISIGTVAVVVGGSDDGTFDGDPPPGLGVSVTVLPINIGTPPSPFPPPSPPTPPPLPPSPPPLPPHDRAPHDREPHDREPHDREPPPPPAPPAPPPHDRMPTHEREPVQPHERTPPHERMPHDREPHDRGLP